MAKAVEVDLSEFLEAAGQGPGPRCGVKIVLASLDPERAAALVAAIDAPHIQLAAIERVLKAWGAARISASTVGRHRQGRCSCD